MTTRRENVRAQLVNELFGESLSSARRMRSLSQAGLGKAVGLSRGTISNIEAGIQNVQLYQVFAFAFALNAPVSELIPLLRDVVTFEDVFGDSDRTFLENAKRQLIEISAFGDDDENT